MHTAHGPLEDTILSARRGQTLAAIALTTGGADAAIAACDVSTGAFEIREVSPDTLGEELASLPISELLVTDEDDARPLVAQESTSRPRRTSRRRLHDMPGPTSDNDDV